MAKKQSKKISEMLASNIKEIATGITSEKLSAQFFDATKLKYQPEPLYRLDSNGHRYYYRFENDEPVFYTSVTTLIKNTLPTQAGLTRWIADRGMDASQAEANERALYGTFLHVECGKLLVDGKYDLDKLPKLLESYLKSNKLPESKMEWANDLKKDILAKAQFIIDYNVKPLAVEIGLYHPTDGYAGTLDEVCEMDWKKDRIRAIIDIKSGKKCFYESHEIQLRAYKFMWNYHFPDANVSNVFNWSPKDWRKSPTYNLKDQTDSKNAEKLPYLVALAKIEDEKRENKVTIIGGAIDLLSGLENNVNEYTFIDLIKRNR